MQKQYRAIITFNEDGYHLYGKRNIETFIQYWPKQIELLVYYEGVKPEIVDDRITYLDRLKDVSTLADFREKFADHKEMNGKINDRYVWECDAVKWSNKSFCQIHAAQNYTTGVDWLIYLDGDTYTHKIIDQSFLDAVLKNEFFISYLGREGMYTETGFMGYNMRHPQSSWFFDYWLKIYQEGHICGLPVRHDCYVFDFIRQQLEIDRNTQNFNISKGVDSTHPFVNTILGEYLDHLKGPRKKSGRSYVSDLLDTNNRKGDWKKETSFQMMLREYIDFKYRRFFHNPLQLIPAIFKKLFK